MFKNVEGSLISNLENLLQEEEFIEIIIQVVHTTLVNKDGIKFLLKTEDHNVMLLIETQQD